MKALITELLHFRPRPNELIRLANSEPRHLFPNIAIKYSIVRYGRLAEHQSVLLRSVARTRSVPHLFEEGLDMLMRVQVRKLDELGYLMKQVAHIRDSNNTLLLSELYREPLEALARAPYHRY